MMRWLDLQRHLARLPSGAPVDNLGGILADVADSPCPKAHTDIMFRQTAEPLRHAHRHDQGAREISRGCWRSKNKTSNRVGLDHVLAGARRLDRGGGEHARRQP